MVQFKSALKTLMVKTEVKPSCKANCLELDANDTALLHPKRARREVEDEDDVISDPNSVTKLNLDISKLLTDIVEGLEANGSKSIFFQKLAILFCFRD